MKTKIALLIVYNHRYDKNIPILNNIYKNRFSNIFHLVPFYDGDVENIIPVYDNSHYFQNYIAQAYTHLRKQNFSHFYLVADDMIINPQLDENNLHDKLGLAYDECYLPRKIILQENKNNCGKKWWGHSHHAVSYSITQKGVEVKNILPSVEEAKKRFELHGIPYSNIPLSVIKPNGRGEYKIAIKCLINRGKINYPLVGGYVDTLIIPSDYMLNFCKYCGAFAATKLFVEIAIPTALVLSTDKIKYNDDVRLKEGDLWNEEQIEFAKSHEFSLVKLNENFPDDVLFYHPVKLSKWII